ncbi:hypothetical protein D3C84_355960 [compost metagenome]
MDLDADTGALWHAAAALLDAGTLQQHVDELGELSRNACWFPLQHIPQTLQVLLQPYVLEREPPTGWLWEAMPPSLCLPDGLVERLSQRLTAALWRLAGERLRPDQLAKLLQQWLDAEPVYDLAELVVLDPRSHGRAYESILGVLRQRGLTEIDWDSATSLAIRSQRYEYLSERLQQHLLNTAPADQERRRQAVAAMIGCQALEGVVKRSPAQHARLQRYVAGEPIATLLDEVRAEQRQRQGLGDCE